MQPSESCERVRACCIALLHTAPHTGAAFVGDPVTNYVDWLAAEQDAVGSYEVQIGIDLLMGDDARRNGARRLLKLGRSELARQACEKLLVNPQLAAVLDKHVGRQPRGVNIEARVNRMVAATKKLERKPVDADVRSAASHRLLTEQRQSRIRSGDADVRHRSS